MPCSASEIHTTDVFQYPKKPAITQKSLTKYLRQVIIEIDFYFHGIRPPARNRLVALSFAFFATLLTERER